MKIKTCIIGDTEVGKTSIIMRLFEDTFSEGTMPTVGVDFKTKKTKVKKVICEVQMWDTTGQERYRAVMANFFKQTQGVFLVFDLTKDKSVLSIEYWLKELDKFLDPKVPKVLLGNKSDLQNALSPTAAQKVKVYCESYDMGFFKVSAKTNECLREAYEVLLEEALEFASQSSKDAVKGSIFLEDSSKAQRDQQEPKRKSCC